MGMAWVTEHGCGAIALCKDFWTCIDLVIFKSYMWGRKVEIVEMDGGKMGIKEEKFWVEKDRGDGA